MPHRDQALSNLEDERADPFRRLLMPTPSAIRPIEQPLGEPGPVGFQRARGDRRPPGRSVPMSFGWDLL